MCKGIKSTQGITWFLENGKIINHIYPDVIDRSKGLQLSRVVKLDYPEDLIQNPYKKADFHGIEETDETELTGSVISGHDKTRKL